MQALQKVAFRTDKLCGTHILSPLYQSLTFRPETVNPQSHSLFMALPPELRLMIYEAAFTPPYNKATNILSLLATCREIHGEAVVLALRTTQFHLDGYKGLNFQSKLRGLGNLAQHL